MTQGRVFVVEDEPIIRQDIIFTLEDAGHQVVGSAGNYDDALQELKKNSPDLVLLDINLEGQKDGIDLGLQLNNQLKLPFIYLTSYYDKATIDRAKSTYPSAYIIKPFDENDLILNIELALFKARKYRQAFSSNKLFVKRNQDLVALQAEDIVYIEAEDNYSNIFTETEKFLVSHTLKKIEDKLSDKGFLRVHKSYLVNFEKIDSISEGMVFLGEYHLPIGKSYKSRLQEFLVTL